MQGRSGRWTAPGSPLLTALLLAGAAWAGGLVSPGETDAAARLEPLPPAVSGDGAYRFLVTRDDGSPATFDPCRPVRWVLRPDGAPAGAQRVVADAVAEVARSTGLRFVYAGTTDEPPTRGRAVSQPQRYGDGPAPVLIAWTTAVETPELAGAQVGLGVASWAGDHERLVSGQVLLDRQDLTGADGGTAPLAAATVLHELAHVVGLGHVDDHEQVMNATVAGRASFGTGDLRGLRLLGSGACA